MPKKERVLGRDKLASSTANRVNVFQLEGDNRNYVKSNNHASNERMDTKDLIESMETEAPVGACAIPGSCGGTNEVDETELRDTRLSMTRQSLDSTSVTITSARVVVDVLVDAIPLEDTLLVKDIPNDVNAIYKKGSILRCRLIAIVVSLLLLAGIVIPAVILTRKTPNNAATIALLEKLKPLLTKASRQELEIPYTVPYLALDWLLNRSNFIPYSFDRQVQRFAMALFFFSTGGTEWKKRQGWLTEDDECTWYQSSNETLCVNGTLQVLALENNNLIGPVPEDIALLRSLTLLNLYFNALTGSIPSEIGQSTELMRLYLFSNSLIGIIPSEIGQCTKLMALGLSSNSLTGSIPSEIGALTNLEELYLHDNDLSGIIPSEIVQFTKLSSLNLLGNTLSGTIPKSLCNKTSNFDALVDDSVTCSCCE